MVSVIGAQTLWRWTYRDRPALRPRAVGDGGVPGDRRYAGGLAASHVEVAQASFVDLDRIGPGHRR